MTKLHKQPPPAYTGRPNSTITLQSAVPYESLPQSTQQPVPVTNAATTASENEFAPTNPFSNAFSPQSGPTNGHSSPFSPVSPIVESQTIQPQAQSQVVAPTPQRGSADSRRPDGEPYAEINAAARPRKPVRVAKDMHDGALPPVYRRQASDTIPPTELAQALSSGQELSGAQGCRKCGKKLGEGHSNCAHCGKRKTSASATTTPAAATPAAHTRNPSEGRTSHRTRVSESTTAGPSSSAGSSPGSTCCNKCGRYKRPSSLASQQSSPEQGRYYAAREPMPMASHPAMKAYQAGLSLQPVTGPPRNSVYPQIDVIPPSATTYRNSLKSPFTFNDESPLVTKPATEQSVSRNTSLIRSLSRRFSRKDKNKDKASPLPLPSQQLATNENQSGEQSAGRLINMISSAMQGPVNDRDASYSRLGEGDQDNRPMSPFSFVGGNEEQNAFEMVDLHDGEMESGQTSLKAVVNHAVTITPAEEYPPIPQDTIDVISRPRTAEPTGQSLSVPGAERPQITRFKSLRSGFSRMNSTVSRSTSLKRLGSLKTVHHNWYRDDMVIEGATGDHAVAAF
ncbi:hypothetical protein LTR10_016241 [Elasticomyces elasticus]|uniref:C2H2-type domain-containing protein n=1 Tax=Exophiala sideris TaxID=1016849 RepID=A0ABR0JPR1_9EURO|nr:hypothetical protein LTR10_016241 [Elasticomyces elasticus]KAK5037927.1 hypothetical protein LTS07_001394 [Exophiala sideris]KAK5043910.1 hypothetical protein LTR13_000264 [Exophiala sideris]KAK5067409.1 hypothetical protein LTR69_001396 [Exophiala sideris]